MKAHQRLSILMLCAILACNVSTTEARGFSPSPSPSPAPRSSPSPSPAPRSSPSPAPAPRSSPSPAPAPRSSPSPSPAPAPAKSGFATVPTQAPKPVDAGPTARIIGTQAEKQATSRAWSDDQKRRAATVGTGVAAGVILHEQQKRAEDTASRSGSTTTGVNQGPQASMPHSESARIRQAERDAATARRDAEDARRRAEDARDEARMANQRANDAWWWSSIWNSSRPRDTVIIREGGGTVSSTAGAPAPDWGSTPRGTTSDSGGGITLWGILKFFIIVGLLSAMFYGGWIWFDRRTQRQQALEQKRSSAAARAIKL